MLSRQTRNMEADQAGAGNAVEGGQGGVLCYSAGVLEPSL